MKLFNLLLFTCIISTAVAKINIENKNYSLLSSALCEVVDKVLTDLAVTLNVVSINSNHENNDFRDSFVKEVTKNPSMLIRQQKLDKLESLYTRGPRKTSLVALQSFADFMKFYSEINDENFLTRGLYIFVLTNGRFSEIEKMFEVFWKLQMYNTNVIYESNDRLLVETFFPFSSQTNCSNTQPVIINEYKLTSFTYDIKEFFPNKMNNLKKCTVRVATSNTSVPYIYMKKMFNGEKRLYGRDYDLIETLAQTLNFRINFTYIGREGYMFTNNTAGGTFLFLLNNKADLTVADYWLKSYRLKYFDASTPYINEKLVFVIPLGSQLSSLEKLLYPLTFSTWMTLIACFIIGSIVIFVIKLQSKTIQNFVFGTRVKYIYLNLWIGLVGTLQHRLPSRNFSRFILTLFLIFCLIIRTAYQGKMYQFMQSNKKHSEPQTINEMIERKYTFTLLNNYADLVIDKTRWGIVDMKPLGLDLFQWAKQIKGDEKNTILLPHTQVYYKLIVNNTRNLMICKEYFMTIPTVIYTIKNFYLLNAINSQIEEFNSAGLIEYWHSLAFDKKYMKAEIDKQPKVLTIAHLSGVFELLLFGLIISFITFIFECVLAKWENYKKHVTKA
ncbi:hypothetical protein PVAND_004068 [Polypedilum vanderplanki]|uniref:Ionotropic receptor n=1 Tax=Polypedilum vanderplanki TaxID=319348 RepID=A0A9J6BVX6_POLVA|nr:hypothetical protein PVAND_004068 [Polypedilum vanderplanki]